MWLKQPNNCMINAALHVCIDCNLSRLLCFLEAKFTNREQHSGSNESQSVSARQELQEIYLKCSFLKQIFLKKT